MFCIQPVQQKHAIKPFEIVKEDNDLSFHITLRNGCHGIYLPEESITTILAVKSVDGQIILSLVAEKDWLKSAVRQLKSFNVRIDGERGWWWRFDLLCDGGTIGDSPLGHGLERFLGFNRLDVTFMAGNLDVFLATRAGSHPTSVGLLFVDGILSFAAQTYTDLFTLPFRDVVLETVVSLKEPVALTTYQLGLLAQSVVRAITSTATTTGSPLARMVGGIFVVVPPFTQGAIIAAVDKTGKGGTTVVVVV